MFTGIITDLGRVKRLRRGDLVDLTIATAFDLVKNLDAVTDIVIAGEQGNPDKLLIAVKCNEMVTPEAAKEMMPQLRAVQQIKVKSRIDTAIEVDYYKHGGILPYVLRELLGKAGPAAAKAA